MKLKALRFITFVLSAVAMAGYVPAFYGDFQYDDSLTILENQHLDRWETFISESMKRSFVL